jgi:Na+-transporting NADH:ubiquinone oxidoreductase subunit D
MGRAESFALANRPFESFVDGIGNGLGYGLILVFVAFIRELLGAGKIIGFKVVPKFFYDAGYQDMGLMLLAPGAFIAIGLIVWLQKSMAK